MLQREVFHKISQLWGPFENDLFASRLNKQVDDYISWKPDPEARAVDAFSVVWYKHSYAFPPFVLIDRCLQKITEEEAEGVLIVPMWPTQTYYSKVMSMVIQPTRLLPMKENLLKLPHSQVSHPLWKKMQLIACLLKQSRPSIKSPVIEFIKYPDNHKICVMNALLSYIERTQTMRESETKLFLTYQKPYHAACPSTFSRWIKSTLTLAEIDTSLVHIVQEQQLHLQLRKQESLL